MEFSLSWIGYAVLIFLIIKSVQIVPQQRLYVIERFGKFSRLLEPGLNFIIPYIEFVRVIHDLRIQQTNVPPQAVITKDNVQVLIDNIIFYQVVDAHAATYGISDFVYGVRNISTATMRQIIGKLELDETLSGREKISAEIRTALDEATEKWGVRIERVEVIDIKPPTDIQEAMDKQMKAERSKRAIVLEAEAAKQDMILRAEGERQSKILKAEAEREAMIRIAEGRKQAQQLEAEGQAIAIESVAEAEKKRVELIQSAQINESFLAYRSMDALKDIANGAANKVFLPTNTADALASIGAMAEVFKPKTETR
jgi:regulator of protease activity HflC (stomatin/prohibitin superfamily)